MKKSSYLIGLMIVLIIGCTGCGKQQSTGGASAASIKESVYQYQSFDYGDVYNRLIKGGDSIYAYGYNWNDEGDGGQEIQIKKMDLDGTVQEEGSILLAPNENLYEMQVDKDGFFYGVKNYFKDDAEGNYTEKYFLCKTTINGEEQFSIELNTMPQLQSLITEEYFYAGSLLLQEEYLYLNVMGTYVKFDKNGNFIKTLEGAAWQEHKNDSFYILDSGKTVAISYDDDGNYTSYVDLETGEFTPKTKIPGNSFEYAFYPGIGYDLYLVSSYGIFGYNVGEDNTTPIMNYINSDFSAYSIYNLIAISETEFFGTYDDMINGTFMVSKFTKVEPEDVKDKTVITLACHNLDWDVRTAVFDFNKKSENYKISVQDYYALYGVENDYTVGMNRLNTDIISGKIPDIILLDSNMPVKSYIAKGLLEDIIPYIDADPELDINHYMPNIIEAFSVEGKLYQVVPTYYINTLVAKASVVGEERGWTVKEAMDLIKNSPEGTEFLSFETRGNMLVNCLSVAGDQFVDFNNGSCNFNSEEFMQLLEFLMLFPEEIDNEAFTDEYWMNYESLWRENKVIAQVSSLYDFSNYNYMEKGNFGEKITMIGYPSANENGSAIVPTIQLAMSAKSEHKEGAWEFLRYFLTDEYQEGDSAYGLPLSIKKLEMLAQKAMKVPFYIDENGKEVETPEFYYLGGVEIPITPMTQKEADDLKKQLYSFTNVYNYDENLIQIVQEESAAYFGGQKSAKEVAEIIQSRAQIYMNENR